MVVLKLNSGVKKKKNMWLLAVKGRPKKPSLKFNFALYILKFTMKK